SQLGCVSLLPTESKATQTRWTSYEQAETEFASILPGETTLKQLKAMDLDPATTPNITLMSHADLLRRLQAVAAFEGPTLDPAIKVCVAARQKCYAYHLEQTLMKRDRVGNFWLDVLNFKQITDVTGWKFDALIIISNDLVVYKTWTGKPNIHEIEQERHPLGPLQGIGSSLVRR
ncbi:MAG: hypothetical protein V4447_16640, partial [Pseudomonadota bacterium]